MTEEEEEKEWERRMNDIMKDMLDYSEYQLKTTKLLFRTIFGRDFND